MVRILVADDHQRVCLALTQIIERADNDWRVCCEVGDGKAAVQKTIELKPDLVVLDFAMPDFDGISAGQQIRALSPNTPVLVYTFMVTPQLEALVRASGLQAVVQKPNTSGLIAEIRRSLSLKAASDRASAAVAS